MIIYLIVITQDYDLYLYAASCTLKVMTAQDKEAVSNSLERCDYSHRAGSICVMLTIMACISRSGLSARVVLPHVEDAVDHDVDSDEEPEGEGFIEEDGDFLQDFPDDTEVRIL